MLAGPFLTFVRGLVDLAGGVFEDDVREHCGVCLVGQVRAEADTGVEGTVEMQLDGWAELMHRLALEAEEDGEGVASFFDADAFGDDGREGVGAGAAGTAAACDAELHVLDAGVFFGAPGEVDHAGSVQSYDGLFGVVVEVLANDEECLAVAVAVGVREGDVGCEGDVARDFFPEITELVAGVPDVVIGGVDGVLLGGGVVGGAIRDERASYVGLVLEDADWRVEVFAGTVKVCRGRYLGVRGGAGLCPCRYGGRWGCLWLRAEQMGCDAEHQGYQRGWGAEFHREANNADADSKGDFPHFGKCECGVRVSAPAGFFAQFRSGGPARITSLHE